MRTPLLGARRCRRKFLRIFPKGFRDDTYVAWERDYKALAHRQWAEHLDQAKFGALIGRKAFAEIALLTVRIEARTNLLFSFEKMALRRSGGITRSTHVRARLVRFCLWQRNCRGEIRTLG